MFAIVIKNIKMSMTIYCRLKKLIYSTNLWAIWLVIKIYWTALVKAIYQVVTSNDQIESFQRNLFIQNNHCWKIDWTLLDQRYDVIFKKNSELCTYWKIIWYASKNSLCFKAISISPAFLDLLKSLLVILRIYRSNFLTNSIHLK